MKTDYSAEAERIVAAWKRIMHMNISKERVEENLRVLDKWREEREHDRTLP